MTTTHKAGLTPGIALGLAALGVSAAPPARAQTFTAVSVTSQAAHGSGDYSMGYTFTPTQNLNVTALGFVQNGSTSNNVQIYAVDSATAPTTGTSVIGPVTVATAGATSSSTFTFTSLPSPVLLKAGTVYEIVGAVDGQTFYQGPTGLVTNDITVGASFYTADTGATAEATPLATTADGNGSTNGLFEPNFQFTLASAAPEPSQFAAFGLGLLGLGGLALRARKSRTPSV